MPADRVVLIRVHSLARETVYFAAGALAIKLGDRCVVDHGGLRTGEMIDELGAGAGAGLGDQLERVVRIATPRDLETHRYNQADAERILFSTREIVARHDLPMHLVAAEYTLDRKQLRIYFTAPHRVDFRTLLRDLAGRYGTRIELRQMGARDAARLKGGLGRCGQEICCHRFLHEPNPIPMELAYDQELFVSPERITGLCGRLMCCLAYEHETYMEELADFPKLGAQVAWKDQQDKTGKVISHNIFRKTVTVLTNDRERVEVGKDELTILRPGKRRRR
ncbi:stage 0 sporulation protein [Candidatus Bipolaricaulota bacterium]|nr:stage 0 sporulation protein [Candidatus Bipolaricaulota bacterium]